MKKKSLFILVLAILAMALVACSSNESASVNDINSVSEAYVSQNSVSESSVSDSLNSSEEIDKDSDNESDEKAAKENNKDSVSDNSVSNNSVSDNVADKVGEDEKKVKEVDRDDIEVLEEPITMYAQSAANIRKGPGTEYDVVGSLKQNDTVEVIGKCRSVAWVEIKLGQDTAFVYSGLLGKEEVVPVVTEALQQPEAADPAAGPDQTATTEVVSTPAVTPAVTPVSAKGGIIFIGDSRTCQMQEATGGRGIGWVCQYGAKYDWFANTAIPQADPLIGAGTKVVICMGVNDPDRVSDYANCLNGKIWEWVGRGAKVYYVSVNPVEEPYINEKAAAIENFNATMPGRLQGGVVWIDTYTIIKQNPGAYPFVDGIHFDTNSNILIFNMIYNCLR